MRKLLMLVTMLLVPTLASAWTMQVKVTNTSAGISAGNQTTLTVGTGTPVVWPVGTKYLYPTNNPLQAVTVVVANQGTAIVSLTGGTLPTPTVAGTNATYVIPANAGKTIQSLSVVYATAAAAPKANIALTQTAGGLTSLSIGSSITTSGYTKVPVGTAVTVKALPSTGWTLTDIRLNGEVVATTSPFTFNVMDSTADAVTATFTKTPVITATLSLPTSGQTGTPVTATVAAATTGTPPVSYAWTLNGNPVGTNAASYSVTPIAGENIVGVTLSAAGAADVTKTAMIYGVDLVAADNYSCTSCHSGSTPAIVASYSRSIHVSEGQTCADCHTSTPHTAGVNSSNVNTTTFKALTAAGPAAQGDYFCWNATCHANRLATDLPRITASSHFAQHNGSACSSCHSTDMHDQNGEFINKCGKCHAATGEAEASKHASVITDFSCRSCHTGTVGYGYSTTPDYANGVFARTSSASASKHRAEMFQYATSNACATCHAAIRTEVRTSIHWNNHLEYGPEFAGGAVAEQMNANEGWTTTENGKLATCALNCHFKPNLGPDPKAKNARATLSPGKDECLACHDPHKLTATYLTCHDCHRQTSTTRAANTGHGLIPAEFYGSKHWKNHLEYGEEFTNQLNTTYANQLQVAEAKVTYDGTTTDGILDANDSYQTTENGGVVTCAYRCHFRPGMGPEKNVGTVLANGKSTGYITYTDTTGKYGTAGIVYSRPGGDSCMACHDAHSLEEATAQSTCYTCHAGSNHGWSVAAFEKSSHFSGITAKADGMDKESCIACHDAHSTEASFANMSSANIIHNAGLTTGCQKCHNGTAEPTIFDANRVGTAPHFQTAAPGADGYYPTGSYDGGGATCIDCHYHNNTINAGWAKGGHASTTSVPLVTSAADNWNRGTKRGAVSNGRTYTGDYTINAQVSDCQRCHTAKGFTLFYDSAFKNVSTVREGIKTSGPITCDACHVPKTAGTKLYNGKVRPLAAGVTNVKTYVGNAKYLTNAADAVTTSMDFPANYANSNVCIPCHAGRGTGALIKASFAAGTVIGDETSPDNPRDILRIGTAVYAHFASVAGVVNGSSAYEYTTPTVASTHNKIGTGTGFGTTSTTMGPCAGCHMTSTEGHSLEAVTYDVEKKITGFTTPVCVTCHGSGFTAATVQAKKEGFEAALNVLRNLLLNKGFDGLQAEIDARPGERVKMNMALGFNAYATAGGTLSIKDFAERNTGAAFNWWQFGKTVKDGKTIILGDPAAYVHNPVYAKKVIIDSIDWMDDFTMNNSAAATIQAQVNAPVKLYGGVADGVVTTQADADKALSFISNAP